MHAGHARFARVYHFGSEQPLRHHIVVHSVSRSSNSITLLLKDTLKTRFTPADCSLCLRESGVTDTMLNSTPLQPRGTSACTSPQKTRSSQYKASHTLRPYGRLSSPQPKRTATRGFVSCRAGRKRTTRPGQAPRAQTASVPDFAYCAVQKPRATGRQNPLLLTALQRS
jgi:hypothetical protein